MQISHGPFILQSLPVGPLKPVASSLASLVNTVTFPDPTNAASSDAASAPTPPSTTAQATKAASAAKSGAAKSDQATQDFLDYMKETPAQRLEDSWLAAHHLTRKDLEAMSPEQRKAIEKQMAADIEQQIKEAAKSKRRTDIVV